MSAAIATARYGPCPSCQALNMAHRRVCYRCRNPLGASIWLRHAARTPDPFLRARSALANARACTRREIFLPNVVLEGRGIVKRQVTVRNISAGGLQFRTTLPCRVGVEVRLLLPLEGQTYLVSGIVRYACPVQEEKWRVYAYGVEFLDAAPFLRRLLNRL